MIYLSKRKSALLLSIFTCFVQNSYAQRYNLNDSLDNLNAYIKVRGSLDSTKEIVFYTEGFVYAMIPEKPIEKIFKFQFYNIARFVPNDSGYTQLTKEILLYENPESEEIVNKWYNPFLKDSVEVIPVLNDPVNQLLKKRKTFVKTISLTDERLCFYFDLPLFYPSPLSIKDWPQNSRSDTYQAMEMFQFFVNKKELNKKKSTTTSCEITWNRISDFLPWMKMGNKPGYLIFSGRGYKLKNGWKDLPIDVKSFVINKAPEFQHAPSIFTFPNMTSWTYYKKLHTEKNK